VFQVAAADPLPGSLSGPTTTIPDRRRRPGAPQRPAAPVPPEPEAPPLPTLTVL